MQNIAIPQPLETIKSKEEIIEKWYKKLGFPQSFDKEFYQMLKEIKISDFTSIKTYDFNEGDGRKNLLSFLYMCENLKQLYDEKAISSEILYDTLKDIVIWTKTWTELKGSLFLGETGWLSNHLDMRLFKLGRLQFCMSKLSEDIPCANLSKGDNVLEVHIPAEGPMLRQSCEQSIEMAKKFFKTYYPDFEYKCFTCHSWLLDTSLKELLDDNSNIIQFQDMFDIVHEEKSDAILRYIFKWDTTRSNLHEAVCTSKFAQKVKDRIISGDDFYSSLGILKI